MTLIMFSATCSKKRLFKKMSYEGTLLDTIGGAPVSGVCIYLRACIPTAKEQCDMYDVGQCYTDASGHFSIHEKAARSDRYEIIIGGGRLSNILIFEQSGISESRLKEKYSIIYLNAR